MNPFSIGHACVAALLLSTVTQGTAPFQASVVQSQAPKLRIVVIAGEDAVNVIQQKTAVAPVVEVRDENNLPVAGVPVTFTVAGNGASFGSGLQAFTATTNAAGRAVAAGLNPLSSGPLQINVTAALQGQTATATIAQTNFLTAAQAAQAGATAPGGSAGAAGGGAGGGGLSPLTITAIAGAAAAGTVVATQVAGGNTAPSVSGATATPSVAILGTDTAIRFSAQASDPDNDALTYQWDFGDGSSSTEASPSHVYQAAGAFTVRVTVRDGAGTATAETAVNIRTLTGRWQSTEVPSNAFGSFVFTLNITQSGTSLAVTSLAYTNSAGSFSDCPFAGSVRGTSPRIVLTQAAGVCTVTLSGNGTTTVIGGNSFELDPGADGNTMTGLLLPTPRPITFTRQ